MMIHNWYIYPIALPREAATVLKSVVAAGKATAVTMAVVGATAAISTTAKTMYFLSLAFSLPIYVCMYVRICMYIYIYMCDLFAGSGSSLGGFAILQTDRPQNDKCRTVCPRHPSPAYPLGKNNGICARCMNTMASLYR